MNVVKTIIKILLGLIMMILPVVLINIVCHTSIGLIIATIIVLPAMIFVAYGFGDGVIEHFKNKKGE